MCGEHQPGTHAGDGPQGSSPHVRGAHLQRKPLVLRPGIIPACAGSTDLRGSVLMRYGDHPRMCGEHVDVAHARVDVAGIIPACAGSTKWTCSKPCATRDHPRMCGEHTRCVWPASSHHGSSPHVRGALHLWPDSIVREGIIPACAGSTCVNAINVPPLWDHPRMCGEHISPDAVNRFGPGSSPHVRGAPSFVREHCGVWGIIPACAGSTPIVRHTPTHTRDHPRMCGEHSILMV